MATVVDHDIPHRGDPELFWDNTFTALCGSCHNSTKARIEAQYQGSALMGVIKAIKDGAHVPHTAQIDTVPNAGAVLVWGPPAAGKTTWARQHSKDTGAIVYDLDDIAEGMNLPRYGRSPAQVTLARSGMIAALSLHPPDSKLVLIACAPTMGHRNRWAKTINAETVKLIIAAESACKARVRLDPARLVHLKEQEEAIQGWFVAAQG